MTFLKKIVGITLGKKEKTIEEYKKDLLSKIGHEQFQRMTDKGLSVPVFFL